MEEFRSAELVDAEVKDMDFRGYAAVFDSPWNQFLVEKMGYVEKIKPGAFRKALRVGNNIPLLWQHERRDMLATTQSGNLRLEEDGKGLLVEAKLPKNPLGEYVRSMIESGDVRGMSYGIVTDLGDRSASTVTKRDGVIHRTINSAKRLIDVTLTWEPSYDATTVELRNQSGFAAPPLQEIFGGEEGQTEEAVTAHHPPEAIEYQRRMQSLRVDLLEKGGW